MRVKSTAAVGRSKQIAWELLWHGCPSELHALRSRVARRIWDEKREQKRSRERNGARLLEYERARMDVELGVIGAVKVYKTLIQDEVRYSERFWPSHYLPHGHTIALEAIVSQFLLKEQEACRQLKSYFYHLMECVSTNVVEGGFVFISK